MIQSEIPVDQLWRSIRREAESAVARDPIFGAALSTAILDHLHFAHALAHQIGERLGKSPADRARFAQLARDAFAGAPDLIDAASRDLQSIAVHDPATTALLLQSLSSDQLQVSIHPSASIGTQVFLDHATGIIIGAFAVIGDEVTILQNVTIGRKLSEPDRAPKIGRGVYLGAGSSIIGGVSIGDFAKIGAAAVVEHDVPPGCTAVGVPARLTNCPEPRISA